MLPELSWVQSRPQSCLCAPSFRCSPSEPRMRRCRNCSSQLHASCVGRMVAVGHVDSCVPSEDGTVESSVSSRKIQIRYWLDPAMAPCVGSVV